MDDCSFKNELIKQLRIQNELKVLELSIALKEHDGEGKEHALIVIKAIMKRLGIE